MFTPAIHQEDEAGSMTEWDFRFFRVNHTYIKFDENSMEYWSLRICSVNFSVSWHKPNKR